MAMACFKERIDRGSKNSKETWIEGKRGRGKPKKKVSGSEENSRDKFL